jgi:hypothetical protein
LVSFWTLRTTLSATWLGTEALPPPMTVLFIA